MASCVAAALHRLFKTPAWQAAVGDDEQRVWLCLEAICEEIGGQEVQLPGRPQLDLIAAEAERNEAIVRAHDAGATYEALATAHGLSTRQIRRITHPRR